MASIEGYFRPHLSQRLATAAIIIKDDTPQWKSKPVIAVRIIEGETLDPDSVYPMEFLRSVASSVGRPFSFPSCGRGFDSHVDA